MDIYSIGLKVDSRQVKTAQKDLGGMGRQAKKTGNSVTNFGRDVDKSTRNVQGMSRGLDLAKRALAGFAAALSIRELQQFTQAALASAQNIERQSKALGVSAEEFQRLSFAFRQFGADSADISDALNTLADRAEDAKSGTQSFVDDFRLVGIEVDDLRGKNPDELFRLFAREVADIEDPTRRAAGVVRILGDDVGRRLIPLLQQGEQGLDRLGDQAQVASEEVIESSARIKSDLTELGTELETGLQNVFLESAARNEEQIRSLVATTLRGMATIADFGDEVSGPLGAGLIGRVLFGKKGAIIGTLLTSAVQTVNALIDRVNETSGQAIVRLQERAESLEQTISGLPEIHPVRQAAEADLERVQTKLDDLNAQRMDSIEIENQYQKALENTGDVGEEIGDVLRGAADAFEATGSTVRTINGPDSLPTVIAGMRDLSVAAQEVLGTTVQIPGSLENIADAGEDAGQTFAEKFEEQFEELGNSLGEALVDGDWESFGETIGDLIGAELSSVLSDQLSSVFGDIGSDLGGSLGTSIGQGLGTAVGGALGGAAGSIIGQEVGGFLDDALGGSEYDLEAVQARQNTGTVLGSIDQKSSSIDNSLEEIQGATDELVNINTGMLRSLQQVQNGIARASGRIAGQQPGAGIEAPAGPSQGEQALGGITATSFGLAGIGAMSLNPITLAGGLINEVLGGPLDGLLEGIAGFVDDIFGGVFSDIGGAIFGGGTSVVDRGVQIIGGEIGARMDETLIRAFARIKEDGGWFSSDDYYNRFAGVPGDVNRQFQLVLGEIVNSVRQGAEALGVLPQDIQQRLDDFVLKTRKISLKGLDADEQQEEIQAAFSAIFDRLAGAVVPFAKDFQNAGEGIGETIARLATQVGVFEELALSLGESIQSLTGRTRTAAATDLAQRLGGTENFAQAIATLEDNFFTEAEQFEANSRRLKSALDDLPLPDTREGFLDLIRAQDEATKSGRENIATLLRLQGSANEYYDYLEQDSGNAAEVARERADLERRVLEIQGKTDQIRQLELEKIDESNRALQQRVWRLEDEAAVERENDRLSRQLLEVQGDTSALRKLELESIDESNRSLQRRIWFLQDEKSIEQERAGLESQLLRVQGDTNEIRRAELEQLAPSNRVLQRRIWRLQDEQQVLQERSALENELLQAYSRSAAMFRQQIAGMTSENAALQIAINLRENVLSAEQEVTQAEQNLASIYKDNAATASNLADQWKNLTDTLRQSADELFGLGGAEPTRSRQSFQQTLSAALSGDREAFDALPQLATELSQQERLQAGTLAESRRANARIANKLNTAADQAEQQYLAQLSEKDIAEKQLDSLEETGLSLEEAKKQLKQAESVLQSTQQANRQAINKLGDLLPDSIVNGLLDPLSPLKQIDASTRAMVQLLDALEPGTTVDDTGTGVEDDDDDVTVEKTATEKIKELYEDILNRSDPDPSGLSYWVNELNTGTPLTEIASEFRETANISDQIEDFYQEYFGKIVDESDQGLLYWVRRARRGVSLSEIEQEFRTHPEAMEFAEGGIASGPTSGYPATLHGTEAVIPLNGERIPLEVNNQEMIQELREVKKELAQLRSEQEQSQYELVKYTKRNNRQFEQWDIDGLPETRTA